jgi:glycosyltransferase involved in cell wall biosynthesis
MKSTSLHILMISKALIVGAYHKKLEEIGALGIQLELVIPDKWGNQYPEILSSPVYTIHKLPALFSGKNHFHCYRHLSRLIEKIRPDVIHIDEESFSFVTFQVLRIAKKNNIPAIFFNWQNIDKRYPWPFSYFERYAFSHASIGIAGTEEVKDVLQRKGCRLPLFVIPQFGVDTAVFIKQPQIELKKKIVGNSDSLVVGYCGRFVEEKGISDILTACSQLPRSVHMVLLGGGLFKSELMKQSSKIGIEERVHIVDSVPSTEMPRYLNIFDCLVLPSHTRPHWKEQFGRVLIEAMACEVPVIGSNSGEIPNVIEHTGLIFPEGNIQALMECLKKILEDKMMRMNLGRAGRERVEKYFTQRKIAVDIVKVYRSVVRI